MEHDFDRIRCSRCKRYFKNRDRVFLDELNTIIHQKCYTINNLFAFIDNGTYREITEKYDF